MKCKYCGTELHSNTCYCIKCGRKNEEEHSHSDAAESSDAAENNKNDTAEKKKFRIEKVILLLAVFLVLVMGITALVVLPPKPKASIAPGSYDDCISVSFSASKWISAGASADIYISADDSGYSPYSGETYELNQNRTYVFELYTVNESGLKSITAKFQYEMNVPTPAELKTSVQPGTYTELQTVEILSEDESSIYYTTDGSEPTMDSALYNSKIELKNGTTTIKAFAVNKRGTMGQVHEWEYVLDLPIPTEVSFSHDSGVYFDTVALELSSDADAVIYYTLDGTEPNENSDIYDGSLDLQNGIYTVKAMAVNEYQMPCETTEMKYAVTYNKYGRYPKSAVTPDGYYGAVGSNGALIRYNAQMEEEKAYDIYNVSIVYSDGEAVYYLSEGNLCKLGSGEDQGTRLIDMRVNEFAVVSGRIYFLSPWVLYSTDLEGNDLQKYDSFTDCIMIGCWENELYFYFDGSAYKITREHEIEQVTELTGSTCFLSDGKMYYINEGSLMCRNTGDGSENTIKQRTIQEYNLDPEYELLNTTDKSRTVYTNYNELFVCNRTLYVLAEITDTVFVYHIITNNTDVNATTSYEWYAVNLDNGSITETDIRTEKMTVFDHCVIDENGNRSTIIP